MQTIERTDLDRLAVDTVRVLAMDAIQKAGSGHPGTAMALAPAAYVLWTRFLKFDPADPEWIDRDRFVLSNGHASVLQYAVLHLTGYPLGIRDLKQQRQLGSRTPGHPEYGHTPGVEVTTGPLGQGVGNSVGFAIAERLLAGRYNRPGQQLVDHRTWVFAGDGDLMEGVSAEASSLAGHLRLGKLTMLYDDNRITIDGPTGITFTEDVARRYEAYGWHVVHVDDANDLEAIAAAYQAAADEPDRPTFIRLRTVIAWGAPNAQGTSKAHGAALGEDEVRATKEVYGWNPDKHFKVPEGVPERWQVRVAANREERAAWQGRLAAYAEAEPALAEEFKATLAGELPAGWDANLEGLFAEPRKQATRKASQQVINALAPNLPALVGGSADLAESNLTDIAGGGDLSPTEVGRNLRFGIREHGMGRSATGWPRTAGCARSAPPSWCSPTTCDRACGWPA
jgi:transketolase